MSGANQFGQPHKRRPSAHFAPSVALGDLQVDPTDPHSWSDRRPKKQGKTVKNLTIMQEILDKERDRIDGRVHTAGITKYDIVKDPEQEAAQKQVFDPLAGRDDFSGVLMSVAKQDSLATSFLNQTAFSALYPRDPNMTGQADNSLVGNAIFPLAGGLTFNRVDYASRYGIGASPQTIKDTYTRNVDLLHESPNRYQELAHWQSSQEATTAENLAVLQRLNHQRIQSLERQLQTSRSKSPKNPNDLPLRRELEQAKLEAERIARLQKRHLPLSAEERLKNQRDHVDRFIDYLDTKDLRKSAEKSGYVLEFDRYECTSPDPKRRMKGFHRVLPDQRRVDPSGMEDEESNESEEEKVTFTESEMKKQKKSKKLQERKQRALKARQDKARLRAEVPLNAENEHQVVDWLWKRLNPTKFPAIPKTHILKYLASYPEFVVAFDFHPRYYQAVIATMVTEKSGFIGYEEFCVILEECGRWSHEMADVLEGRITGDEYPGPIEEPETPKLPPAPTPSIPSIKLTPPVPNQPNNDNDKPKQPEKPKEGSSEPVQPGTSSSKQGGELKIRPGIRDPEVSNVRKAFGSLFFGSKKSENSSQPENSEFSLQPNFKEPEHSEPAPNVAFEFESVVPDSVGAVPPAKSLTTEQFMEIDGLIKQLFKSLSTPQSSFVEKQKFLDHFYAEDRLTKYLSYAIFSQASQTPQVTLRHVLEKFKTLAPEKFSFSDLYRCFLMAQGQQAPGPESGSHSSPREGMDTLKVPGPQSEVIFEIDRSGDGSSSIQKSKQNDYKPISQRDMLFSSLRSLLNSGDALPKPKGSNSPDLGSKKSALGARALGVKPVSMWSDSSITTFQADPRGPMNLRPGVVIEQLEESQEGSMIGGAPTESQNFDVLLFPQAVIKFGHNQSFGPIGGISPTASLQSQQVGGFGARLQKAPTMEMLETNSLRGPAMTHGSRKDNPQQASVAQNQGQVKPAVVDTLKPFRVLHTPAEPFSQTRKSLERSIASNTKHLLESRLEADRRRERIRAKKAEAEQAKQAKEEMYKALKAKYQERLQAGVHGQSKHGKPTSKKTVVGSLVTDGGKRVAQAV